MPTCKVPPSWIRLDALGRSPIVEHCGGDAPFEQGLYVASELISNPLFSLFEDGIVRRRVYEEERLQEMVSAGVLPQHLPEDLFDWLWKSGKLPAQLDTQTVQAFVRHGLLQEGVLVEGGHLLLPDGRRLYNDLGAAEVRDALNRFRGERLSGGIAMHGAFFIGPGDFYRRLQELPEDRRALIGMTSVAEVNRIYTHYQLERLQRPHARFINITMKATLLGAAVSDQLKDGQVVSGVGGQYNFVSMAHQLPDGRSILLLRATRGEGKKLESNIVWEYPHTTIPRHLRDVFVTEYGIADLRGKTDRECIASMLAIADSRCQDALMQQAQRAGKLPADYRIADAHRQNLPSRIDAALQPYSCVLPKLPFGSDLTDQELALIERLRRLKAASETWGGRLKLIKALAAPPSAQRGDVRFALSHLELDAPKNGAERRMARLVRAAHNL